jgi:hypothetical protein
MNGRRHQFAETCIHFRKVGKVTRSQGQISINIYPSKQCYHYCLLFIYYRFIFNFHPVSLTLAAIYRAHPIVAQNPENNIIGPNPLAQVPRINKAPEIGIPVNPAMPQNADSKPSLLLTPQKGRYIPSADFLDR